MLNSYVYRLFSLGFQESYCHCFHSFLPCAASPLERKLKHCPIGRATQPPRQIAIHLKSWLDSCCLQNILLLELHVKKWTFFLKVRSVHLDCGMDTSLYFGRPMKHYRGWGCYFCEGWMNRWVCGGWCPLVVPTPKGLFLVLKFWQQVRMGIKIKTRGQRLPRVLMIFGSHPCRKNFSSCPPQSQGYHLCFYYCIPRPAGI